MTIIISSMYNTLFHKTLLTVLFLSSALLVFGQENAKYGELYYQLDNSTQQATVANGDYSNIKEVIIPKVINVEGKDYSVTKIAEGCFINCSTLETIVIPQTVTTVGNGSFNGCTALKKVHISDGAETLELGYKTSEVSGLFYDCPLEELYLGRNINYDSRSSGDQPQFKISPFKGTVLNTIRIGNHVTKIPISCFSGTKISSIEIPNSVTQIDDAAFWACSNLTDVKLSDNTTIIGGYAFSGCPFSKITIPSKVEYINAGAFQQCKNLTEISIPSSVIMIGNGGAGYYAGRTFEQCESLKTITFERSDNPIKYCNNLHELFYVESAFIGRNITISRGYIGSRDPENDSKSLFQNIKNISFSDNVNSLPEYFLYSCGQIKKITLNSAINTIGSNAFSYCSKLTNITIENEEPIDITANIFQGINCNSITLLVPKSSIDTYQNADIWNTFGNIKSIAGRFTLGAIGKGTYCSEYDLDFTNATDVKAYVASGYNHNTGQILLTRVKEVPAGTGIMVVGTEGEHEIPISGNIDYTYANLFVGTTSSYTFPNNDGHTYYILANGDDGVMFYQATGEINANKAYLKIPEETNANKALAIRFIEGENDDTTDINDIQTYDNTRYIFNLNGQRAKSPTKGLYIINGKKLLIK
ncbi:MAG: leucine-rich repeat protein [Lachnospiraceae bacterium]